MMKPVEIHPTRFEYVSSVRAADMLKLTIADPGYFFIDHPLLVEDLKTEVRFKFGYNGVVSDLGEMLFYRQKPSFTESGVETTLTCYDFGLLLMLPTMPRLYAKPEGYKIEEFVRMQAEEVNSDWGIGLQVDFGDDVSPDSNDIFEGGRYRMSRATGSRMQFLYELRQVAKRKNERTQAFMEVYVEGKTLHFRPPRKDKKPIGVYSYFSRYLGDRLLSFTPEVNLNPTSKKALGVDPKTGSVIMDEAGNREGTRRVVMSVKVNAVDGAELVPTAGETGDVVGGSTAQARVRKTQHTVSQDKTSLQAIAAQYNVSDRVLADMNGIDFENPQIKPGQTLDVPELDEDDADLEDGDDETPVSTSEGEVLASGIYLKEEDEAFKAKATVLGHPELVAGWPIVFRNVGKQWSGSWYIEEASHIWDEGGYVVELDVNKDGVTRTEGMEDSTSGDRNTSVTPVSASEQMVNVDVVSGWDTETQTDRL